MNKEEYAKLLVENFPDKAEALENHRKEYEGLLGHIFFAEEVAAPLLELLRTNADQPQIKKYCAFLENMWRTGSSEIRNIVNVSILEKLSDTPELWKRFGGYLSEDFKQYINKEVIPNNIMMLVVDRL